MEGIRNSERGQAIVLLAVSLIVLLGFTALAIDGGMAYTDRRHAQNAADSAAMSGALQKANNQNDTQAKLAATNSATTNGYDAARMHVTISPYTDFSGSYILVTVVITSTPSTSFVQLFYGGQIKNVVSATARVRMSQEVIPGSAVIAMGNCVDDHGSLVNGNGGGNSGGLRTYDGGIFVNAPENGGDPCALDAGNSHGGYGIQSGAPIYSVGSYDYGDSGQNMSPLPINTGINDGVPINDPLEGLKEPLCYGDGSIVGGVHQPGNYGGPGQPAMTPGDYAPGIYCISGDVHLSGSEFISGDGMVMYLKNGRIVYSGQSYLDISAPNSSNCQGDPESGDPTYRYASCSYAGIAIFAARSNTNLIEVTGNGSNAVTGMIYTLNGEVRANGGGSTPEDAAIVGQVICSRLTTDGGADFTITYDAASVWHRPTEISLHK